MANDCHLCTTAEQVNDSNLVYRDEHWLATTVADVPGWVMLSTARHVEGLWNLTVEEAEGAGRLQQKLAAILREVTNAELVYVMSFGETQKHCHFMLMTRYADTPEESRGLGLLPKVAELADRNEAIRIAGLLRARAMPEDQSDR